VAWRDRSGLSALTGFIWTSVENSEYRPRGAPLRAALIRKTQPYAKKIAHERTWFEPELLAEIQMREAAKPAMAPIERIGSGA
jgi:hypothetical protein